VPEESLRALLQIIQSDLKNLDGKVTLVAQIPSADEVRTPFTRKFRLYYGYPSMLGGITASQLFLTMNLILSRRLTNVHFEDHLATQALENPETQF
jgi:hypothetical protein